MANEWTISLSISNTNGTFTYERNKRNKRF